MVLSEVFPDDISVGCRGGVGFLSSVAALPSGVTKINSLRASPIRTFDVSHVSNKDDEKRELLRFFMVAHGKLNQFRFKDWTDYDAKGAEGVFTQISATEFQMVKRYSVGANAHDRKITRPVSSSIVITGGVSPVVDDTTGIVTVSSGTPTSWVGEFDILARFDFDEQSISITDYGIYDWSAIKIVEVIENA